jgi:hypothetical protein
MGAISPVLYRALSFGIQAPTFLNTQPWKIKVFDTGSFLLFVDEKRLLPASDPTTRQIHIGQGTFIEMLAVGMTSEGYGTEVDYFPEGIYGVKECGTKPVALITVQKNEGIPVDILSEVIPVRITNRNPYHGPPIRATEWESLKSLAGPTHSAIFTVDEEEEVRKFVRIAQ